MKLFAAAVRVDSQPRYLRRAASCALAARQPRAPSNMRRKRTRWRPTIRRRRACSLPHFAPLENCPTPRKCW